MTELIKLILDFDSTLKYITETLDDVNVLSSNLLSILNITQGHFFTLLPKNANIEKIYEFDVGEILPQNPVNEYYVSGEKAYYSIIPTIRDELSKLIFEQLNKSQHWTCFFDDVTGLKKDKKHNELFYEYALFSNDEIYYALNNKDANCKLISRCLDISNAFWHSLCVISESDFCNKLDKELSNKDMENICLNTKIFLVGAYDGEGYVFWESQSINFGS